jgi:cell division protease FtsH
LLFRHFANYPQDKITGANPTFLTSSLDLGSTVTVIDHSIQGCQMPITNNRKSAALPPSIPTGLIFMAWAMLMLAWPSENYSRQSYSEFIQQVEAGQVSKAVIDDQEIRYELKVPVIPATPKNSPAKSVFITRRLPDDVELAKILRSNQVEHSVTAPNPLNGLWSILSWVGIPLLFLVLWSKFAGGNRANGLGMLGIGDSHAKAYSAGDTGVTFNDVAGIDEAKAELQEIVDFLKHAEKYVKLGAKIPKGVLLVGPPGTGKTLLAKAIAGEAGVPFFSISGSEFIEMFVGVGAARVRGLFERAKQEAPCIVFIDELDALGKSRSNINSPVGGNDEREQTLNQLLSEMDGFAANTGVILLSATNRPEVLDPALLRPGRFDRQIVVDRPDKIGRQAILLVHVRQVKLAADVDLLKIAARTPGFAGADLANLVNEAALLAARHDQNSVTMADFSEAIERLLAGLEKKSRVLNDLEKETVAYHEVGHAIVGSLMPGSGSIEKISIVPRGVAALGYTLQLPQEDRFLMVEDELRGQIAMLLGGRSAEELIMGKVSTGASDDIQKATDLADRYVSIYGMSKQLGPMAYDRSASQFLGGWNNPRRPLSPQVEATIDRGIKNLIDHAHHAAQEILAHNEQLLRQMALVLQEKETLEGEQLHTYLRQVQIPPLLDSWLQTGEIESTHTVNGQIPVMNSSHNQLSYEYSR